MVPLNASKNTPPLKNLSSTTISKKMRIPLNLGINLEKSSIWQLISYPQNLHSMPVFFIALSRTLQQRTEEVGARHRHQRQGQAHRRAGTAGRTAKSHHCLQRQADPKVRVHPRAEGRSARKHPGQQQEAHAKHSGVCYDQLGHALQCQKNRRHPRRGPGLQSVIELQNSNPNHNQIILSSRCGRDHPPLSSLSLSHFSH
jgi:hypothetical protein